MASILSLPAELLANVFEYLDTADVKRLTLLCAGWDVCRAEARRLLLKNLVLTEESARMFQDGGGFKYLRGTVSSIRFDGFSDTSASLKAKLELLKFYAKIIPLFPSVERVRLDVACSQLPIHKVIFNSILHVLRKSCPSLREVTTSRVALTAEEHKSEEQTWLFPNTTTVTRHGLLAKEVIQEDDVLEEEAAVFAKGGDNGILIIPSQVVAVAYPPSLRSLTIDVPEDKWSFYPNSSYTNSNHPKWQFLNPQNVPTSLEAVKLRVSEFVSWVPYAYDIRTRQIEFGESEIFRSITSLELETAVEMRLTDLWEIMQYFPMLQELVITCEDGWADVAPYQGVAYYSLYHLKHLKRVTLPLPRHTTSRHTINSLTFDCPSSSFYNFARQAGTIRNFVAMGIKSLRKVWFVRRIIEDVGVDEDGRIKIRDLAPPMMRYSDYEKEPPEEGMTKRKKYIWVEWTFVSRQEMYWHTWDSYQPGRPAAETDPSEQILYGSRPLY